MRVPARTPTAPPPLGDGAVGIGQAGADQAVFVGP